MCFYYQVVDRSLQPNPKSEVQISIENVIRGPVKEGSFVAIQLPRWPPFFSLGLTARRIPGEMQQFGV